jgi:hypothetical protein
VPHYYLRMTTIGILGGTGPHGRRLARRFAQAGQVEALAAHLIAINRRYRVHAGLKITELQ